MPMRRLARLERKEKEEPLFPCASCSRLFCEESLKKHKEVCEGGRGRRTLPFGTNIELNETVPEKFEKKEQEVELDGGLGKDQREKAEQGPEEPLPRGREDLGDYAPSSKAKKAKPVFDSICHYLKNTPSADLLGVIKAENRDVSSFSRLRRGRQSPFQESLKKQKLSMKTLRAEKKEKKVRFTKTIDIDFSESKAQEAPSVKTATPLRKVGKPPINAKSRKYDFEFPSESRHTRSRPSSAPAVGTKTQMPRSRAVVQTDLTPPQSPNCTDKHRFYSQPNHVFGLDVSSFFTSSECLDSSEATTCVSPAGEPEKEELKFIPGLLPSPRKVVQLSKAGRKATSRHVEQKDIPTFEFVMKSRREEELKKEKKRGSKSLVVRGGKNTSLNFINLKDFEKKSESEKKQFVFSGRGNKLGNTQKHEVKELNLFRTKKYSEKKYARENNSQFPRNVKKKTKKEEFGIKGNIVTLDTLWKFKKVNR